MVPIIARNKAEDSVPLGFREFVLSEIGFPSFAGERGER
jgi:hypothetical protein